MLGIFKMMNDYQKSFISIRYFLIGAKMYNALKALEFACKFHTGTRKDGKTPEYFHQLTIAQYLRTMIKDLSFPEETLATAFLHDVPEDYEISHEEISLLFGREISSAVYVLTKQFRGNKLETSTYYSNITQNEIASVVKGADRIHNIQSMPDVFNHEKQIKYIEETEKYVLPMLKSARRKFVQQEPIYENEKLILTSQIALIQNALQKE